MPSYPKNAVYFCEAARSADTNPITIHHKMLLLVLIVDPVSGEILDAEINSICDITSDFVRQMLLGYSLRTDVEHMEAEVKARYYGASSGGLVSSIRASAKRLEDHFPAAKVKK